MSLQNKLDDIYPLLNQLIGNNLKNNIISNFPIIISLGDQSSGKSSIFSRIINKQLPTKDGVCTKVPIMIQTRDNDGLISIRVNDNDNEFYDENKNFEDCIDEAQNTALGGNEFSHTLIKISIPNQRYNLTFIDLPGLTAYNQHNKDDPNNISFNILKEIKNQYDKAIFFHIIDCNTEPEKSQSLNEIKQIINENKKIITVYTKSDRFENQNKFNELDSKITGKKFIMNGIDVPERQLNTYDIGIDKVLEYVNKINEKNIQENINSFSKEVKKEYKYITERLESDLQPYNELKERINIIRKFKSDFDCSVNYFNLWYKAQLSKIIQDLKYEKISDDYEKININDIENYDEFYIINSNLHIKIINKGEYNLKNSFNKSYFYSIGIKEYSHNNLIKYIEDNNYEDIIYEGYDINDVIKNIKKILNNSGDLEPEIIKNKKPVFLHYGQIFSNKNNNIQEKFLEIFKKYLNEHFVDDIENNEIKELIINILNELYNKIENDIERLHLKNSTNQLINTPNIHYFAENIKKGLTDGKSMAKDEGCYIAIINELNAFFKVESKYVIERTTDMFNEMFYYRFKEITNFLDPYYNIEDSDYITKQILLPLNNLMSSLSVSDCDDREQERSKALINEKILKDILNILDK